MLKAYKYRIYPNAAQKAQLVNFFGCVRFAYNIGLETKIQAWTRGRVRLNCFDLINQMVELKNTDAPWLKECPAQALQMALRNLDNAYTKFFKGGGFPKFKNKYSKQSIQFPQDVSIKDNKIKLPILKAVDILIHRPIGEGKVKMTTLSKTSTGKYFVSILVDNQEELPTKKPINEQTALGVDLGIKTLATLSDGTSIPNLRFFKEMRGKLRRHQRSLSRKQKTSHRREKQRLNVAKCHEKIRNQRSDYLHKISSLLISKSDTIIMEDLNIQGMMKNRKLSLAIGEIGWYQFITYLKYKCEWNGKNFIQIGRFEPSSKVCSNCGRINKYLTLKDRSWDCNGCGIHHDRDVNAAINIKNFGLRVEPSIVNVAQ